MKKTSCFFKLLLALMLVVNSKILAQPGNLPAPYCMPLYGQSPCNQPGPSNMPGNFLNDFIHSVLTFSGNVDINNPNTGCNAQNFPSIGFRNYIYHKCAHNLSVNAGQVVSFSIQIGQINPQGVSVWIDWNADNVFSAAPEKIGWSTGTVPAGGWLTFTTTIPPTQPSGVYRMRVRCAYLANGSTLDPCANYSCGETEDYDVYVGTTSPVISNVVASSNSSLCSGNTLSLNLTYTSQCTPSFTWAGPSGFFSTVQNPTITNAVPLNSGNYTVTVTCGTVCPVVVTTSVTIAQAPTTANAGTTICTCVTAVLLNANTPSIGTGSWTLISGAATIVNPTSPNSMLTAIGIGTNVLMWTITNGPCVSTSTVAVIHDQMPTPSISGPNQTITCSTNTATMQANTPAVGVGTWSLVSGSGTFVSPNSPNTQVTGIGTGTNVYMWIISNPTWCNCQPVSTSTMAVIHFTNIVVNVVANPPAVCTGSNSTLTASGATSYTWTGSAISGTLIQSVVVATAGTFYIIGEAGACGTNSTMIVVQSLASPTILTGSSSSLVCAGDQATLTASGATNYSWTSFGSGSVIVVSPTVTTTFTVTGSNANGCLDIKTITQNVSPCTSVIDNSPIDGIRVYPNPAGDILNFVMKHKSQIKLFDTNGKLILQKSVKDGDRVDVSELAKGIYFLFFENEKEPIKILKE